MIKTWNMNLTSLYFIFKIQMILQKMKVEKIFTVEGNFTWFAVVTILHEWLSKKNNIFT